MTTELASDEQSPLARDKHRLLRSVFGIRIGADGTARIPLRHTWKAFSRIEFLAFWLVTPYGYVMGNQAVWAACHFGSYLLAGSLFYVGLAASLIIRRRLTAAANYRAAVLSQRQEHRLRITGAVLGSSRRRRQAYILLDGVQFPLMNRRFVGSPGRLAALQVVRDWLGPQDPGPSPAPNSPAAFLALLDVLSIEGKRMSFRATWSKSSTIAFVCSSLLASLLFGAVLVGLQPSTADLATMFDTHLVILALISVGLAVFLQRSKPKITVTAGEWAEVLEHGESFKCPAWQARFVVKRPDPMPGDDAVGPIYPSIELKYGERSLNIHSSRRYDADELEEFAKRMNHFLWGGPTLPENPAQKPLRC